MKQIAAKTCHSPKKYKQKAMPWSIIIASILLGLVGGCAWFGGGSQSEANVPAVSAPPQKINESNAAMPIIPPNNASGTAKTQVSSTPKNVPRIQEERENGVVNEIKVNNKNLPSYYIYPTQQQNYDYNRIPDSNVTTPNWQISW
ncbi:MAG TPA: hypothetical protein VKR58_07890 [Aquella sp.]|nr:hypothetical protein [Aquella sp.]